MTIIFTYKIIKFEFTYFNKLKTLKSKLIEIDQNGFVKIFLHNYVYIVSSTWASNVKHWTLNWIDHRNFLKVNKNKKLHMSNFIMKKILSKHNRVRLRTPWFTPNKEQHKNALAFKAELDKRCGLETNQDLNFRFQI